MRDQFFWGGLFLMSSTCCCAAVKVSSDRKQENCKLRGNLEKPPRQKKILMPSTNRENL